MAERLSIGNTAPNAELLDVSGQITTLMSLWKHGPTLLTFLRHFG